MMKHRIAPTRRLGLNKREAQRRGARKVTKATPTPAGLPSGLAGRVEHMRAHAMSYFAEDPRSPQGEFLWKMADVLAQKDE